MEESQKIDVSLAYADTEQCPCCGRTDRVLVARIADGTVNTHTTGTVSGSGIGVGSGGVGVGVGLARVNLDSVSQTRLQSATDRVEVSSPNYAQNTMYSIIIILLIAIMFKCSTGVMTATMPLVDTNSGNMSKGLNSVANAAPQMMSIIMILFGIAVLGVIAMKILSLPKDAEKDATAEEQNKKIANHLEDYYRTLRYCDNCHVVFDRAGYATFVTNGAIEKLSRNAGIFDLRPIKNKRLFNMVI